MKIYKINEFEKVVSEDINDLQKSIHESIYDKILYPFLQREDGVLGDSFTVTRDSTSQVTVKAGRAFMLDAAQVSPEPKFQAIELPDDTALTLGSGDWAAGPSAPNKRWDIIVIRMSSEVTDTANRYIKTAGVGPIVQEEIDKVIEQLCEIDVVEGTPHASSPVVPSTPTGWMKIAEVYVTGGTGIAVSGDVIDTRNVLVPAIQTLNSEDRYVSPSGVGTDTSLQSAISNLPVGGGSILILEDITIGAVHTLPANTVLRGKHRGIIVTLDSGSRIDVGANCDISLLKFVTTQAALMFFKLTGNYSNIEKCIFSADVDDTNTYVKVESDGNNIAQNIFEHVLTPSTNTAIEFADGTSNNSEEKNIFTV